MIKGMTAGLLMLACASASMNTVANPVVGGESSVINWRLDAEGCRETIWSKRGSRCATTVVVHLNEEASGDFRRDEWHNDDIKGVILNGCTPTGPVFLVFGETVECRVLPNVLLTAEAWHECTDGNCEASKKGGQHCDRISGTVQKVK